MTEKERPNVLIAMSYHGSRRALEDLFEGENIGFVEASSAEEIIEKVGNPQEKISGVLLEWGIPSRERKISEPERLVEKIHGIDSALPILIYALERRDSPQGKRVVAKGAEGVIFDDDENLLDGFNMIRDFPALYERNRMRIASMGSPGDLPKLGPQIPGFGK